MDRKRQMDIQNLTGAAMVCSVIANTHRDPSKKREPFTTEDFLPPATPEEADERRQRQELAKRTRTQLQFAAARNIMTDMRKPPRKR